MTRTTAGGRLEQIGTMGLRLADAAQRFQRRAEAAGLRDGRGHAAGSARCASTPSRRLVDATQRAVELARRATGTHKFLRRNKVEATFCLGSPAALRLAARQQRGRAAAGRPRQRPAADRKEDHFISINATTEVDLYGQCASETIAGRYWSSSGGQADFARGAMYSNGGKAFIVLHSATSKGRSRIRVRLTEGSVVTTLKNTVDHVVTEWGIAKLRGRSLAERAQALIAIAHPDHREELEREAVEAGLLRKGGPRAGEPPAGRRAHASSPIG